MAEPPSFNPPTPDQLAQHLDEHPPQLPTPWVAWGPLIAVAVIAVIGLLLGGPAAVVLPWLAMAGLFVFLMLRIRNARLLEARTNQAHELVMLRRYPQALRRGWELLPQLVRHPLLHARLVALMAQCLDHLRAYEAAMIGYDYLLKHLPDEHPGVVQLRVQRTIAALGAHYLSDADDGLRRLRSDLAETDPQSPVAAAYRLAQLIQQVRTNHFTDAVDQSDNLLEDLRPLSVDAGYGHALLALCHHHCGDFAARRLWWDRARLLLPVPAMLGRFPELEPLTHPADVSR